METALLWVGIALAGVLGLLGAYWVYLRLMLTESPRANERYQVPTADGWTVRVCRYRRGETTGPPAILCHGIMANQFSLVAPPGDSLVDVLIERGFDCWVMDARGTRSSTAPTGGSRYDAKASDYALQDMPAVIDFVRSKTGYSKVHWVGHSMGGMMLYMYLLAFGSGAIGSGTTLGSPPGLDHFKPQRVRGLLFLSGLMPVVVEFFWRCGSVFFRTFKVQSRLVPINWDNLDARADKATFFNMVEFLPYPAANELTGWIREKQWTIANGTIDVGNRLSEMDAPLLLVYGSDDWFTPLERGEALFESLRARSKRMLVLGRTTGCRHDYSHVDLVFSPRGRTELYEPIAAWMEAHPVKKGEIQASAGTMLELEERPAAPRAAPRAHRPSDRRRGKTSGRRRKKSSQRSNPRKKTSSTTKGGKKDVYATQKKVARKKKAAKKKNQSNPGSKAKKKTAGTKPAKKKTAAKKKPATKKPVKKKAASKKKPATKKPAGKKTAKKKPAKRKR